LRRRGRREEALRVGVGGEGMWRGGESR
jgi:hypothetical protein